jgi:hypothetical protein
MQSYMPLSARHGNTALLCCSLLRSYTRVTLNLFSFEELQLHQSASAARAMAVGEVEVVRGDAVFGCEGVREAFAIKLQLHESRRPAVGGGRDLRDDHALRRGHQIRVPPYDWLHRGGATVRAAVGAANDEAEVPARAGQRSGVVELDARRHVGAVHGDGALVLVQYPRELRQRGAGEEVLVEADDARHLQTRLRFGS